MTSLELDYVVFLGDPEDGAPALPSAKVLSEIAKHSESLQVDSMYGAMTFTRGGKELAARKADPILPLLTNIMRAVRYVIDGEPETALFTESECGLLFEPSGDDVYISFFLGDPGEPEKVLLPQTAIKLAKWGEQVIGMGDRLAEILKKLDPDFLETDDHGKSFRDFLKEGKEAFRTFQLEVERGLRV
jgi:hypothetical protein